MRMCPFMECKLWQQTFLDTLHHISQSQILVEFHIEMNLSQGLAQIITIDIGSSSRFQRRYFEHFMIEYQRNATLWMIHIVFGRIPFDRHTSNLCLNDSIPFMSRMRIYTWKFGWNVAFRNVLHLPDRTPSISGVVWVVFSHFPQLIHSQNVKNSN